MKLEHRFSFFIFQLSEKMNDPNIHALTEDLDARKMEAFQLNTIKSKKDKM